MQKLMVTVAALAAAFTMSAQATEPSAASYVSDGLVGLWDAEENAGYGTHEAAPAVWKNLVDAGVEGRVPDFQLTGSGTFEEKALYKTSAGAVATNDVVVTDARFQTVEVVMSDIPDTGYAIGLYATNRQWIGVNDGVEANRRRIYTCYWHSSGLDTGRKPKVASISALYTVSGGKLIAVTDKTMQGGSTASNYNNGNEPLAGCTLSVGGVTGKKSDYNNPTGYRIHSIRLYNRQLTDAERQQNLMVDNVRFGATIYDLASTEFIWTGAAGDGKFSSVGNWQGGFAPVADYAMGNLIMTNDGPATVENDIGTLSFKRFIICQKSDATQAVTVKGEPFVLTSNNTRWHQHLYALHAKCPLTFDADLTFSSTSYGEARIYGTTVFNGDVVINAKNYFWMENTLSGKSGAYVETTFNGTVTAENANPLLFCGSYMYYHFYGAVTGKVVNMSGSLSYLNYHAAGNSWTTTVEMYDGRIAEVANALPSDFVFTWSWPAGTDYGDDGAHRYVLRGDQTCDRIESQAIIGKKGGTGDAFMRWRNRIYSDTADVTLTLKGTADAASYGPLISENGKKLNIVWDPTDDYTQTIGGFEHTMIGEIVVKGGTFASAGTNTFAGVTALRVADKATFAVTNCEYGVATNPFTGTTDLYLSGTGKVSVPAGVTVTVNRAYRNGVPLKAATYGADCGWVTGAGAVTVAVSDGTGWKDAATSGYWNDPANWTDGVPTDGKKAYLTAEGADYTVTMTNNAAWPQDLLIRGANVTLAIPEGTAIEYDGAGKTTAIAIEDGGTLLVDGGTLAITNFTGTFTVGSTVTASSRVAVASGRLSYAPAASGSPMTFKAGGLADVTGGELLIIEVYQLWNGSGRREPYLLDGGNISVSGDGNLNFAYKSEMYARMPGEVRFTGNARAAGIPSWRDVGTKNKAESCLYLMPAEDETLTWTFEDHSSVAFDGGLNLGSKYGGGRAVLNFFSDAQQYLPYNLFAGYHCGYGEVNITNGVFQGRNGMPRGLAVGLSETKSSRWGAGVPQVEGVVNMSGGAMTICRDGITGWGQDARILGLDIGYGQQDGATTGGPCVGTLNLSGGAITNNQGNTVVGMGLGVGAFNVSGGTYYTYNADRAHFVGLAGGTGTVVQTGGELLFAGDVYLGGAWTNATYQGSKLVERGWDVTRHDAAGTVVHSNGTFVAGGNLVLGADGVGTLDIVGAAGAFTVGGDLILSNHVENAASGGAVNFTFGEGGVTPVMVAGKAVFRSNAKMTVDVSGYAGVQSKWLVKAAGGMEGTPDITLTGVEGRFTRAFVRRESNGYRFIIPRGLLIMFK